MLVVMAAGSLCAASAHADPAAAQQITATKTPEATRESPPAAPAIVEDRIARVRWNYEALLRGELAIRDLGPQDMQDIIDFDRALRGVQPDTRTPAQMCVDEEVRRAGGRPSRLAWQVIALKCREIGSGLSR